MDGSYGQSPPAHSSHKSAPINDHRSNSIRLKPPLTNKRSIQKLSPKSNIEVISSDDERNESTRGTSNDNSKGYGRKKRRTRERKTPNSAVVDSESRCTQHGRRYCISCNPSELALRHRKEKRQNQRHDERNTKPRKNNYPNQSDDDDLYHHGDMLRMLSIYDEKQSEEELVRNREILRMALNFYDKNDRTISKSTLSHKLAALDDVDLQTSRESRKRRKSLSDDVLRETSNRKVRHSKESECKPKKAKIRIDKSRENDDANDIDIYDDTMSLEEQELRLIALKSAVLKKHEQRKKKQQADNVPIVRPYSPTDSVIMAEEMEQTNECIDSDNNNMDISPITSPEWQNDDMELVTSNDDSKSPIFTFADKSTEIQQPTFVDWQTFAMPVQMNTTFLKPIPTTFPPAQQPVPILGESQPFAVPHSTNGNNFESEAKNEIIVDNEHELRAQLIVQLRNHSPSQAIPNDSIDVGSNPENIKNEQRPTTADDAIKLHDDSLEEDCLRSLLLSTKGKKLKDINKEMLSQPNTIEMALLPNTTANDTRKSDDMPEVMSNLRGALKRLRAQGKQPTAEELSCNGMTRDMNGHLIDGDSIEVVEPTPILDKQTVTIPKPCDDDDEKTVDNAALDSNEGDFCATKSVLEQRATNENVTVPTSLITQCTSVNVGTDENQASVIKSNELVASSRQVDLKDAKQQALPAQQKQQPKVVAKLLAKPIEPAKKASIVGITTIKAAPTVNKLATTNAKILSNASQTIAKSIETKLIANKSAIIPIVSPKPDVLRKSTASPVIPGWTARPVKKVIIRPFEDSTTDSDGNISDTMITTKKVSEVTLNPMGTNTDDRGFEQSLDMFLNTVRANVTSEKMNAASITKAQKISAPKVTASSAVKSTTLESSKSVRHLPLSSQLEYHRLIKRMQLLEKQREQKSQITPHSSTQATPSKNTEQDLPKITITLRNENRFVRTDQEATAGAAVAEKSAIKCASLIKSTTNDATPTNKTTQTIIRVNTSTDAASSDTKTPNAEPPSNRPTVTASPEKKTKSKAAILDSYVNKYNSQR